MNFDFTEVDLGAEMIISRTAAQKLILLHSYEVGRKAQLHAITGAKSYGYRASKSMIAVKLAFS
jgi:hypothetical protein